MTHGLQLAGAVTVVTGTSSGLGRQLALDLASNGALVTGLARRETLQRELAAELGRRSPGSEALVCDVADLEAFTAILDEIEHRRGRIDLLVNNAAAFEPDDVTVEGVRHVLETNFMATVAGTLAVLPGMEARGRGAVVNVSSDIVRAPVPGEAAYAGSKAAISAFTESLSYLAAARGVQLHLVYPGYIPRDQPGRRRSYGERLTVRTDEQVSRLVLEAVRTGRLEVNAAHVARLALVAKAIAPRLFHKTVPGAAGTTQVAGGG